ncbi:MAG: TIGR02996 domain-containing protein [Gemmataceae bacterium]
MSVESVETWRGFLEAVRESPDDDLNRLAWADWYEDHGEEARATFVRAQVQAARLPEGPTRDALEDQADDLLACHERDWLDGLDSLAIDWQWQRGLLEGVTLSAARMLEEGSLLERFPLRSLRLLGNEVSYQGVLDWPGWRHIERLDLGRHPETLPGLSIPNYRDSAFAGLLQTAPLERLRSLRLSGHEITGPTVQRLLDRHWSRLERLDVSGCSTFGDRATRMLAEAAAPLLESLQMAHTNASEGGLRTALATKCWPALQRLHVSLSAMFRRGVSSDAFRELLLDAPLLPRIGIVDFSHRSVDAATLALLFRCPRLGPIEELNLADCHLGATEMRVLADWPGLLQVKRLNLSSNPFGDAGLLELLASPYLGGLRDLLLANNRLSGVSLQRLYQHPDLTRLKRLHLGGNFVGYSGLKLLAESPLRPVELSLPHVMLPSASGTVLAQSPTFERLRVLHLEGNRLSDEGVRRLTSGRSLRRLRVLGLEANDLDSPSLQPLRDREAWPLLRIVSVGLNHLSLAEKAVLRERYGHGLVG